MNLKELYEARNMTKSDEFQKYFATPMKEYMSKQAKAYDCKDINELSTVKGRYEAVKYFISLIKQIEEDIRVAELKSDAE